MDELDSHQATHNTETSAWISIQPTLVNGLSLSKNELRDAMRRRYGLGLVNLSQFVDGCGAKFTIEHALACKKYGLAVGRHNEVKIETGGIAIQELDSNQVRNKLNTVTCRNTPNA